MSFQILKVVAEALPYVISGAEIIFKTFREFEGIKPGESVEIPLGYSVKNLPDNCCLETSHTDHMVSKSVGSTVKFMTSFEYGKEIVARIVNLGKTILTIKKGEPLIRGILKTIGNMITPTLLDPFDPENEYYQQIHSIGKTKAIEKKKNEKRKPPF